jgi:tetratricopeptide (TPR) repeat protein
VDDIKRKVRVKLSDESYGTWLLIIDNADDASTLFSHFGGMLDYIPLSRRGYIIFTTRTRAVALRLAERNLISIGELDGVEAAELLQRRLVPERQQQVGERDTFNAFLAMLTYLPLAIIQAAAYINMNDVALADYMTLFRTNENDLIELQSEEEFESPDRPQDSKNAVATTWSVSFKELKQREPVAADILSFMACVANNEIPASILPITSISAVQQMEAISALKAYHFVTVRQNQELRQNQGEQYVETYDVHPLIHLAMRSWLKAHDELDTWRTQAMIRLSECIRDVNIETRDAWRASLPHAIHVATLSGKDISEESILLLSRITCCERTLGRYEAAERSCRQAVDQRRTLSGKDHIEGKLIDQLVNALFDLKRFEEAEALLDDLIIKDVRSHLEARRRHARSDSLEKSMTKVPTSPSGTVNSSSSRAEPWYHSALTGWESTFSFVIMY